MMNERNETPRVGGPEVPEKAQRRKFSAAYRLRIVEEADRCQEPGQIGEILRREGLYGSQLATWRRQRAAGELTEGKSPKRGRKRKAVDPTRVELEQIQRENARLTERLRQAEAIIEVQKKVSSLLGVSLTPLSGESGR
ncbi:MAG: transposase [Pirellulales bacterium]